MHTRPAQPTDIPTIATISARAFQSDELYNFTFPYFREHQRDFRDYFLRRTRLRYWTPGYVFYVAETDAGDHPVNSPTNPDDAKRGGGGGGEEVEGGGERAEEVVGFALYNLQPPAGASLLASSPPLLTPYTAVLERTLASLHNTYIALLQLDRSVSPSRARLWRTQEAAAFRRFWDEQGPVGNEDGRGYYTLQNLCVEPRWQRKGVGARLIELGQREARREGIRVVLTSSEAGAGLYARMGFVRKGELRVEGWRRERRHRREEKMDDPGEGAEGEKDDVEKGDLQNGLVVGEAGEAKGKEEEDWFIVPIFVWEREQEESRAEASPTRLR